MPEIFENMREKFDQVVNRIGEFLSGPGGYRVEEVRARIPDIREIVGAHLAKHLPSSSNRCGR